jgi:RNA polymerase sigma-70 factor, ECF subfamily
MTDPVAQLPRPVPSGEGDSPSPDIHAPPEPRLAQLDESLAARVRAGDVEAFKAIFDMYCEPLQVYVVGLVQDRDAAAECVQEVMYQVWNLGPRWVLRESLRSYLYTAARNRALSYLRRQRLIDRWNAAATGGDTISGMSQGPEGTDEACRRNELAAAIRAAVARLPERRRVAITLRGEYRMTNPQIAQAMGTSIQNVEKHIALALRSLRKALDPFF